MGRIPSKIQPRWRVLATKVTAEKVLGFAAIPRTVEPMKPSGVVGVILLLVGIVVAFASLGTPCYATTIPGVVPSGASCNETFVLSAGGALLAVFGLMMTVRGR